MARALFFCMVIRKFSEITNNKPIFSQNNVFYNYEYFFFQSAFWSLFNHRQRSQSNQEQCKLCYNLPCFLGVLCTHERSLQCFSTYFHKLKEIGILRSIFPGYVISCDKMFWHVSCIHINEFSLIDFRTDCIMMIQDFVSQCQQVLIIWSFLDSSSY